MGIWHVHTYLQKKLEVCHGTGRNVIVGCIFASGAFQIIRGIAMGLALIMYGREEGAETLVEQMTRDQDPILRQAN